MENKTKNPTEGCGKECDGCVGYDKLFKCGEHYGFGGIDGIGCEYCPECKAQAKGQLEIINEMIEWLILNRDTRIKLLIESSKYDLLNGLLYEVNEKIKQLTSRKQELEKVGESGK